MATFTDAQVAAYIRDNNLDASGIANAKNVFGLTDSQISSAQGLLSSGAGSVNDASNAYKTAVAANPSAASDNKAFYDPSTNTGWGASGLVATAAPASISAPVSEPAAAPTATPAAATTSSLFDPSNTSHTQALSDAYGNMKNLISAGNEQGAKDFYNSKKRQYGFTDDQFANFGSKGAFTGSQFASWASPAAAANTNYTNAQIKSAVDASRAQGFSDADIVKGLNAKGIVDPARIELAMNPSKYALPAGTPVGPNSQYASGYGGAQPEGSKYAGDNPMPTTYMERLPALRANTDAWINYALNEAIAQARSNGIDPETSSVIQTLRGYYSGDAQARSDAIHSISSLLLAKGGGYETTDYGYHAIGGNAPTGNTTAPTFTSTWDKDWNRPTLYDQINSSIGWGDGTGVNYADPKNRNAELNRKLTDAEIAAFQSGKLTPELKALVSKYGASSNPSFNPSTGSSASVGSLPSTGASTSGSTGSLGLLGSTSSTASNAPISSSYTAPAITPDQTIEGRVNSLLATDANGNYTNQVVRQAVDRAYQTFAGRGLLNSSMAQQAAQEAAIAKAIEIAGPDAATYATQARDAAQFGYTSALKNQDFGYTTALKNQDASIAAQRDATLYGYDMAKLNANLGMSQKQLDAQIAASKLSAETTLKTTEINRQYTQMANLSSTANSMLTAYNTNISRIIESDLDAAAKDAAINQYTQYFKIGMQLQGSIAGDVDFSALMDSLFAGV